MLDVFFELSEFVHQICDLSNSIIMLEYSIEGSPPILILILFQIALISPYELLKQTLNICVVSYIIGNVAHAVLYSMVDSSFTDQELNYVRLTLLARKMKCGISIGVNGVLIEC